MADVVKAAPSMYDDICELLLGFSEVQVTPAQWRALLEADWDATGRGPGYVLLDGHRIVGFVGTLYKDRWLGERLVPTCNLATWIVRKDFREDPANRAHVVRLGAAPFRDRDPDLTFTLLTPAEATYGALMRAGFQDLDVVARVVPACREIAVPRPRLSFVEADEIASQLDARQAVIADDHRPYGLRQLLFVDGAERCWVVFRYSQLLKVTRVDHVSNPTLFVRHEAEVLRHIGEMAELDTVCILPRLIDDLPLTLGHDHPLVKQRPAFRSRVVDRKAIDHLYSELAVVPI
jgi:hypothetical protein